MKITKRKAFDDLVEIEKEVGINTGYWLNEQGEYYSPIYCEKMVKYAKKYEINIPSLEEFRNFDDDYEYELQDKMAHKLTLEIEDKIKEILEI